ncbi:MAG: hypothetical protein LCH95_12440 [Proteobacteria bacterium]|nr:hypothetical protein [Pseudomonadota bacterium]
MVFRYVPLGFAPGFNVMEEDDDVPGFNVRQEDAYPWINVGAEDVAAAQRETSGVENDPNVVPAAWGDLKCSVCGAGKHSGMTGAYSINGQIECFYCALKEPQFQGVPSSELPKLLEEYQLEPEGLRYPEPERTPPTPRPPQTPQPQTPQPQTPKPQTPQPETPQPKSPRPRPPVRPRR